MGVKTLKNIKVAKNDGVMVAEALEKIKEIVSEVKGESFSNFESLKDQVSRMLMQPENL